MMTPVKTFCRPLHLRRSSALWALGLLVLGCGPVDSAESTTGTSAGGSSGLPTCAEGTRRCALDGSANLEVCNEKSQWQLEKVCAAGCKKAEGSESCHAITDVALSQTAACALRDDGKAFCWGDSAHGQLGDGELAAGIFRRGQPAAVKDLPETKFIAGGALHFCAVGADDLVRCWGDNRYRHTADSDEQALALPVQVPGMDSKVDLSLGYRHSCGHRADSSSPTCWGSRDNGQVPMSQGTYTAAKNNTPLPSTKLYALGFQTCSAGGEGEKFNCWGSDFTEEPSGPGGDDTLRAIPAFDGLTFGAAGGFHFCAVSSGGELLCMGRGSEGQLGRDVSASGWQSPAAASGGLAKPDFIALSAGDKHTCAITSSRKVQCWGSNNKGQLGSAATASGPTPVEVPGLENVQQLASGGDYNCALVGSDEIHCWGDNSGLQLGNATVTEPQSAKPVKVSPFKLSD